MPPLVPLTVGFLMDYPDRRVVWRFRFLYDIISFHLVDLFLELLPKVRGMSVLFDDNGNVVGSGDALFYTVSLAQFIPR